MPANTQVALFDLDNTLTDHAAAFALWAAEFSRESGIPLPWLMKAEERHAGVRHVFFEEVKETFGIRQSVAALHGAYRGRCAELVPYRPEVCTAVQALAEDGWALGVVTNGAPEAQRRKLDVSQLARYFSSVIISGEYGVRKPDSALFRLAMDDLQVEDATRAVMVGDCLATDVAGGLRAGLRTVWVSGGRTLHPDAPVPTYIVRDVVEASGLLRDLSLASVGGPSHPT
ncbi:HAD family hydrolase [Streptomyces prunicolor]|uniref:HAD family hydrolase n=1 Tax=Streptomyces prunicolor TaxID=67348 RepID=UPI0005B89A41|nr:HAD family hydrolase [Streptomyces prunicolor]